MIKRSLFIGLIFFLIVIAFFSNGLFAQNDEITLYNSDGKPVAYIAINEDYTIYLWDGNPVAYLYESSNSIHLYTFEGKHLGWLEDGIIKDHEGNVAGFTKGAINIPTQYEPYKSYKKFKPAKGSRELPPSKPSFSDKWSLIPLNVFLAVGNAEPALLVEDIDNGNKILIMRSNGEAWLLEAKTWCNWASEYEDQRIWIDFGYVDTEVANNEGEVSEFWTDKEINY